MKKQLTGSSRVVSWAFLATAIFTINGAAQVPSSVFDSVVTVLLAADGQAQAVGTGLIVRSDGYIMVPQSLVRGAREIQIRLNNGEMYDKAEVVTSDDRRNVAILRINASGLSYIPNGASEETQVGSPIVVLTSPSGKLFIKNGLKLNSVQMADSVEGAGKGYRVMHFDEVDGANFTGGLVLDARGRTLGMVTTTPDVKGQNIAVPLSSLVGMIRSVPNFGAVPTAYTGSSTYPAPSQTPVPIPQNSVLVPQRGITPLPATGPGSVVVKPSTVPEILAVSKTIYVESNTVFFKPQQLVNALNDRKEISEWGLSFTNERQLADLILELDHVVLTYKFTFKLYSQRLGTVVATGSRIIWDGNLGAPYMAERVIEKLKAARGDDKKSPNVNPAAVPVDKPDAAPVTDKKDKE
jgi:S1-C subfamily serine protease